MKNQVNLALQVLPRAKDKDTYQLVDKAIEVIQKSGVKYTVTPFETVMEGDYDTLMRIVKQAQQACYNAGAQEVMTYIKIQTSAEKDVTIDDKLEKYS